MLGKRMESIFTHWDPAQYLTSPPALGEGQIRACLILGQITYCLHEKQAAETGTMGLNV